MAVYFKAKCYDVTSQTWLDESFADYCIPVFSGEFTHSTLQRTDNVRRSDLDDDTYTLSMFYKMYNEGIAGHVYRFCLTDSHEQNFIELLNGDAGATLFYAAIDYNGTKKDGVLSSAGAPSNEKFPWITEYPATTSTWAGSLYWSSARQSYSVYTAYYIFSDPFDGTMTIADAFNALMQLSPAEPGDPFGPGGHSTHGGGGRSFDDSSDPVALPVPSTDYALNSGFLTMYQVNANKLNDLASFMWNTSLFDVETWQKIMANPFDAIISLTAIPANPGVLSDRAIKIGNVVTTVSAPVVADQFVQINCGTLDVEEYSGSYLDYSPFTKIEIYLPYIGFRDINTDEVMDKTLTLVYNVDVLSGACVANILVDNTVLYQFAGDCAMQIPVTGRDPAKTLSSVLGVVTSAGSLAGGAIMGTLNPQSAVKAVTATAESVIGGKRNIQRSGNISGSAGFMGGQTPYIIITRPRQALPEDQNLFMGYPSYITSTLGDLTGMTIVSEIHLEGIPCTKEELAEIERLLKEGVIL